VHGPRGRGAQRDQQVHQQGQQRHGRDREEGCEHPAARRPEAGGEARTAEGRQAPGQRRIVVGQLALYLSEDPLLFHGKRHDSTSAQRAWGLPSTIPQHSIFIRSLLSRPGYPGRPGNGGYPAGQEQDGVSNMCLP
jgi:hypothetical protein